MTEHAMANRLDPAAIALLRQGNVALTTGRSPDALPFYEAALRAEPRLAEAWFGLGGALVALGRCAEAEEACHRGLRLHPAHAVGLGNLGTALSGLGRYALARGCFEAALGRNPDFVQAHINLAQVLGHEGRFTDAIARYTRALAIAPNALAARLGLVHVLSHSGRITDAIAEVDTAVRGHPDSVEAATRHADLLVRAGRFAEAETPLARIDALQAGDLAMSAQRLMSLNHLPHWTPERVHAAHVVWGRLQGEAACRTGPVPVHDPTHDRTPERRLRIGYVSPDLRFHPVGRFVLPLLAEHDRAQVHVTCYAAVPAPDTVTDQIAAHADAWCSIVGLDDDALCARIVADRIDILVDLSGHTAAHRLSAFARKPAPVQVTWLGYLNTTGLAAIDYRFTDAVLDPPEAGDAFSSERLLRLPSGFVCFAPSAEAPDVAPLPALSAGGITFGVVNRTAKLNLDIARLWARIVTAVPGSRLAVQTGEFRDRGVRAGVAAMLTAAGLSTDRITLLDDPVDYPAYLARFAGIDILLDPGPYSGVTTTCEALWQGVPAVTLRGDRHAARAGSTVIYHAGLGDLIADTPEDYVATAIALAEDGPALAILRTGLRKRLQGSNLCDQCGFARSVETAYAEIWRTWCQNS